MYTKKIFQILILETINICKILYLRWHRKQFSNNNKKIVIFLVKEPPPMSENMGRHLRFYREENNNML